LLSRRSLVLASVLPATVRAASAPSRMMLCMNQNTSLAAGYRKSLEGWSRAGIKYVELSAPLVDDFLKTDNKAAARRILSDLDLTAVSCLSAVTDLWNPGPNQQGALDALRSRCDLMSALGIDRLVFNTRTTRKFTQDDYKLVIDNMRAAGEIAKQYRMIAMVEFVRDSSFLSTLPTTLKMTRQAAHPNVRPMLDLFHFWAGMSKFEDLELIHPGEIAHVHFQDVPDFPRELLDNTMRWVPGEGVSPLPRILRQLAVKGYAGPLSVELPHPMFQQTDPYEMARRIREKGEPIMRQARVL
jgi:sugar phosphate isomerase/epimerase